MEKSFNLKSKSGSQFEIVTQILVEKSNMGGYTKKLEVIEAKVNGKEIPKNKHSNKPFMMEVTSVYQKSKKYIALSIKYSAWEYVTKALGVKTKQDSGYVLAGKDLEEYYMNDFQSKSENIIEKMKAEEAKRLESSFNDIKNNDIIEFSKHSSYGISICHEAKEHKFFRNATETIEKSNIEINDKFQTHLDMGDYSITTYYKMTFEEFERLVKEAQDTIKKIASKKAEKEAKKQFEEKKVFEKAKKMGEPQVLKRWSEPCNDPKEECSLDNVTLYAMPDGTTKIKRYHTY